MHDLIVDYKKRKKDIKKRLSEFEAAWEGSEEKVFSELCFCICTPQSKAIYCDKAISNLSGSGGLFKGSLEDIRVGLEAVRFPNNKAKYILAARNLFTEAGQLKIRSRIDVKNNIETRDWLVTNVKGLGFKEASHFLRNIGQGKGLAILDVHILRNLFKYKVINKIPATISKKSYLDIEHMMRGFSKTTKIPLEELDLLFWSRQTGFIFK